MSRSYSYCDRSETVSGWNLCAISTLFVNLVTLAVHKISIGYEFYTTLLESPTLLMRLSNTLKTLYVSFIPI
jgi:hypothetical protein